MSTMLIRKAQVATQVLLLSFSLSAMQEDPTPPRISPLTTTISGDTITIDIQRHNSHGELSRISHVAVRAHDIPDEALCNTAIDCYFVDDVDPVIRSLVTPLVLRQINAAQVDPHGDRHALNQLVELYVARERNKLIAGNENESFGDSRELPYALHCMVTQAVKDAIKHQTLQAHEAHYKLEKQQRNTKIIITCILVAGTFVAAVTTATVALVVNYAK